MDKDKQRIAIAEACGYRMVEGLYAFPSMEMLKKRFPPEILEQIHAVDYEVIPDYLNSLDAMHEAEKWLRGTDKQYLSDPVYQKRWKEYQWAIVSNFGVSACADNRAETFLKVLNLWQPEPERRGGADHVS